MLAVMADNYSDPAWDRIINDLLEAGYTETELARACQTSQPNIHKLSRPREGGRRRVMYALGYCLVGLHKRLMERKRRRERRAHRN